MLKKSALFISAASVILVAAYGCSSSKSTTETNEDAGNTVTPDAGNTTPDAGKTTPDSGNTTPDTGVADTGPAVPSCYASPTGGYPTVTTLTAPASYQGLCTVPAIQAYLAACGDNGSDSLCTAWQTANIAGLLPDGGGAGTACGNCTFPGIDDAGNFLYNAPIFITNPNQDINGANIGACVAIEDPSTGAACDVAYANVSNCIDVACGNCTSDYGACVTYSSGTGGGCATQAAAANTACGAGAAATASTTCNAGATANAQDPSTAFVMNLICGSADAGTITDGDAGTAPVDAGSDAAEGDAAGSDAGDAATGG